MLWWWFRGEERADRENAMVIRLFEVCVTRVGIHTHGENIACNTGLLSTQWLSCFFQVVPRQITNSVAWAYHITELDKTHRQRQRQDKEYRKIP